MKSSKSISLIPGSSGAGGYTHIAGHLNYIKMFFDLYSLDE